MLCSVASLKRLVRNYRGICSWREAKAFFLPVYLERDEAELDYTGYLALESNADKLILRILRHSINWKHHHFGDVMAGGVLRFNKYTFPREEKLNVGTWQPPGKPLFSRADLIQGYIHLNRLYWSKWSSERAPFKPIFSPFVDLTTYGDQYVGMMRYTSIKKLFADTVAMEKNVKHIKGCAIMGAWLGWLLVSIILRKWYSSRRPLVKSGG